VSAPEVEVGGVNFAVAIAVGGQIEAGLAQRFAP
jgi:hypothetical protein